MFPCRKPPCSRRGCNSSSASRLTTFSTVCSSRSLATALETRSRWVTPSRRLGRMTAPPVPGRFSSPERSFFRRDLTILGSEQECNGPEGASSGPRRDDLIVGDGRGLRSRGAVLWLDVFRRRGRRFACRLRQVRQRDAQCLLNRLHVVNVQVLQLFGR